MAGEKVLVVGAGVAGSILAYWLAKYDYRVTVVERSRASQKMGQGIEIEEPALKVVKAMGIMDELNKVRTGEAGFELVNAKNEAWVSVGVGDLSPTGALEMMRGDLTEVLYKAADKSEKVTYNFETTVRNLRQVDDKVTVDLEDRSSKRKWTEDFDLVIGADGVKSRTRAQVMGPPEELDCYKPVGAFTAYFSIDKEDQDWPRSRMCHYPGRRIIWTRPISRESKHTSAILIHCKDDIPELQKAIAAGDRPKQKQALAKLYSGLGWEAPRVMSQMAEAENFYADEVTQVKLDTWSQGRVALVGDAAWAPTQFTGQGNQLAIIGAWVLAQEMSRNRSPVAFQIYEKRLRPYVLQSQNIPLWGYAPYIFNPETGWGIAILRSILGFVSLIARLVIWTGLSKLLPEGQSDDFDLQIKDSLSEKC